MFTMFILSLIWRRNLPFAEASKHIGQTQSITANYGRHIHPYLEAIILESSDKLVYTLSLL